MAAASIPRTLRLPFPPHGPVAVQRTSALATPEIYFGKGIDNRRLVKFADPARNREMKQFTGAVCLMFVLVLLFVVQHFSSIQYGYRIEAQKKTRDSLVEMNRQLRLDEARLRDPDRIDRLARGMGMQAPPAGQVVPMENSGEDSTEPVMARSFGIAVITAPR